MIFLIPTTKCKPCVWIPSPSQKLLPPRTKTPKKPCHTPLQNQIQVIQHFVLFIWPNPIIHVEGEHSPRYNKEIRKEYHQVELFPSKFIEVFGGGLCMYLICQIKQGYKLVQLDKSFTFLALCMRVIQPFVVPLGTNLLYIDVLIMLK
jgi:hypothetical protein